MAERMALQCGRMAAVAAEYCAFIDRFDVSHCASGCGPEGDENWLVSLEKLFPRLHVAVIALMESSGSMHGYRLTDDDQRCELFLRLNGVLQADEALWAVYENQYTKQQTRHELCERMADNLTDMYFDLKRGLVLVNESPELAAHGWQCSFYAHWGKHLLDAECWLHSVDAGGEPPKLPEWQWPNTSKQAVSQA